MNQELTNNPFNPLTTISMELDAATPLQAVVFDVRGRRVRELFAGNHPAGPVRLQWNGQDDRGRAVSSGTYLFRITTPTETRVARAVLVR